MRASEPILEWKDDIPFAIRDNTLCPANEKVYEFMDKEITELAYLFPSDYIHMRGDEAPFNFGEKNSQEKKL